MIAWFIWLGRNESNLAALGRRIGASGRSAFVTTATEARPPAASGTRGCFLRAAVRSLDAHSWATPAGTSDLARHQGPGPSGCVSRFHKRAPRDDHFLRWIATAKERRIDDQS
jgi:hypothetical protein